MKFKNIIFLSITFLVFQLACHINNQQSSNEINEGVDTIKSSGQTSDIVQCDVCDSYTYEHYNNQNDILFTDDEIGEILGQHRIQEFKDKMTKEPKAKYTLSLSMPELVDDGNIKGHTYLSVSDRSIGEVIYKGTFVRTRNEKEIDGLIKLETYIDQYSGGEKILSSLKSDNIVSFKLHPNGIVLNNMTLTIPLDLDQAIFISSSTPKRNIDYSTSTINTTDNNLVSGSKPNEKDFQMNENNSAEAYDSELLRQRSVERQYKYSFGDYWYDFYPLMVVVSEKAYFYETTEYSSKSHNYCIKGDEVAIEKNEEHWVYATYFDGTQLTKGFMKKEELSKVTTILEESFGEAKSLVDGLRVRLKPGMNESVLYLMQKDEKASYVGFKTNYSTPALINGKDYDEPWYYVRINENIKGWVHGCCIEIILDTFEGE